MDHLPAEAGPPSGLSHVDADLLTALVDLGADRMRDLAWTMLGRRPGANRTVVDAVVHIAPHLCRSQDPQGLLPRLYASVRREALRRIRVGDRLQLSAHAQPLVHLDLVEDSTTRALWQAATDLDPRERAVLDLVLRHRLSVPEFAESVNSTHSVAVALGNRTLDLAGQTLAILVTARDPQSSCCAALRAMAPKVGLRMSELDRLRLAGHLAHCQACRQACPRVPEVAERYASVPLLPHDAALPSAILRDSRMAAPMPTRALDGSAPVEPSRHARTRRVTPIGALLVAYA